MNSLKALENLVRTLMSFRLLLLISDFLSVKKIILPIDINKGKISLNSISISSKLKTSSYFIYISKSLFYSFSSNFSLSMNSLKKSLKDELPDDESSFSFFSVVVFSLFSSFSLISSSSLSLDSSVILS